jgi:hypothetical protein
MPVTGYQVRMLWNDATQGIAENYYWNTASDDPSLVVYPAALNLMKARSALMGYGVLPVSFRISVLNQFRSYLNSNPSDVRTMQVGPAVLSIDNSAPGLPPGVPATVDGSAAEANETVIVTAYNTLQNHSRRFLSGAPSVMIRTDPTGPFVVGVSSWQGLFNQYATLLINQPKWCFKARVPAAAAGLYAPVNLVNPFVQLDPANDGTWDVLLPASAGPPYAVGNKIQIRGFKMKSRAYTSFNGIWTVGNVTNGPVAGTVWIKLLGSTKVSGTQVMIPGYALYVDYNLYPYTSLIPTGQGTHKRGNRGLGSPGKRRVVPRIT